MANNNETTTKFKADISELKKQFQEAKRQIRLANSEFKAATSDMDKWSDSADGISAKLKQLNDVLDGEKKKLKSLEDQYALVVQEQGEASNGAQELKIKINNQKAVIGETEKQIKNYNERLTEMQSDSNKTESAMDSLKNTISKQEDELSKLKDEYANIIIEQGKNSDSAKELADKISNLSGDLNDNKKALSDAKTTADDLDKSFDEVEESSEDTSDGFTTMKGVLTDLISKGIQVAIEAFKNLASAAKEAYDEFDVGYDNLIKATGATGETAKDLKNSYKNVAKSVKGDFGDIGSAVGEVNTRFGYTGEQLEKTTTAFMKFADITGTDATQAVQLVSRAMGDAGIDSSEYATVLDELAAAGQASSISVDKLTEYLTKYGAPMRALGFDTKESIAIFSQWEKAGVNTEIAFSGMKNAISKWSAEGKDAKEEFKKTLDEIASAPDIASATTKAIEVFGKKAGPDLADAVQNGRFEYSDFLKIIEDSSGTVENTYEQTQDGFDKISLATQELKTDVADAFKEMMDEYGPDIEAAIDKIKEFLNKAFEKFTNDILPKIKDAFDWIIKHLPEIEAGIVGIGTAFAAWKVVGIITAVTTALKGMSAAEIVAAAKTWLLNTALLANPISLVIAAVVGLVAAFVVLWNKSEKFRNFWIGLWEKIKEVAGVVWEAISGFFSAAWDKIQEIWGGITEFFSGLWESIKTIFSVVADWINTWVFQPIMAFFQPVIDFFVTSWNIISELAKGCWEAIKIIWNIVAPWINQHVIQPVKNFFTTMWNGIKTAASVTWEAIKKVWNVVSGWFDKTIITPVKNFFKGMWDKLKSGASDAWEGIKKVFGVVADWFEEKFANAWQKVKDVFSTGGKVFDGIKDGIVDAFKTVVNAIIQGINQVIAIPFNAINDALDIIRDVDIAGFQPFEGLISRFDIPQIPELARGGVLKKGQKGFLEGDGAEAVVPLEKNTKWLDEIANRLYNKMNLPSQLAMASPQQTATINNFYQTNNSPKALSRLEIYRQSKNLLRMKR